MPEDCARVDAAKQEGRPPKLLQANGRVAVPAGTCTFSEYYRYHADRCAHGLCILRFHHTNHKHCHIIMGAQS